MKAQRFSIPVLVVAAVVLLAVLLVLGRFCSTAATINVTVNGTPLSIHGAKTMQTAIRESGLPVNPGDLISLTGTVLKKSEGQPFAATVNGRETVNPDFPLNDGDTITLSDGDDIVEDYDFVDEAIPHSAAIGGVGAICSFEPGVDGVLEVRTGRISGDVVRHVREDETDATCTCYNPDVGDDKVIALTFDQGPSEEFTAGILDVLRDNDARATFFCVGTSVEGNADLVRRERSEGHQVCTNTYDRKWEPSEKEASGKGDSGKSSGEGSTAEGGSEERPDMSGLIDEVEHGRAVISDALGGEEASRIVRLPNSTLTSDMAAALDAHVDATVGWNVDTGDWAGATHEAIYEILMGVEAGDIVLLHDGGGDCSATVEALGKALPRLKKLGYSFVTIDDLMGYPAL